MKLAEALSQRAELQTRISQLKEMLKSNSKIQEGDEPTESFGELEAELESCLGQFEDLVYRINVTNFRTLVGGESLTRLMARKDALAKRVEIMRAVVAYANESDSRYGRSELRSIRVINVSDYRKKADEAAKRLRQLDMAIQSVNWTVDLVEDGQS